MDFGRAIHRPQRLAIPRLALLLSSALATALSYGGSGLSGGAPDPLGRPPALPERLRDPVVSELARLGFGRVRSVRDVTPERADVAATHLLYETQEGSVFCKVHPTKDLAAFAAEAASLRTLRSASMGGLLRVPAPLGHGTLPLGGSYLLLEWIEPSAAALDDRALEKLGAGLANLHTAPQPPIDGLYYDGLYVGRGFGFSHNTHLGIARESALGELCQDNRWRKTLADFFLEQRLEPMLDAAEEGFGSHEEMRRLRQPVLQAASDLLSPLADAPSVLHGGLWPGNVYADRGGTPVLHDPACWYGQPEFDLSLAELTGRFGEPFYEAYHELRPKRDGFDERQRLYMLYHLLVRLALRGPTADRRYSVNAAIASRADYESVLTLMRRIAAR